MRFRGLQYRSSTSNVYRVEPLQKAISTLPAGATAQLLFEDTPFNDFGSLARTIAQHFAPSGEPDNVLVAPSMIPVGFFNQVVPDGYADIGFSWSSLNYLRTVPSVSLDATASPADFVAARREAFSTAGHADLVRLFHLRAREIREGGHFIAAIGGQKPAAEQTLSSTGFEPLQGAMMKMIGTGSLSSSELMQMALFPTHERTLEDVRTALDEVAPLWEVEHIEAKLIEHPAWATYQAALEAAGGDAGKKDEAVRAYAYAVVVNLLSSSGWFWVDVLKKARGPEWDSGDAFLDELTKLSIEECVEKFADMKVQIWYHYVKLRRTGKVEGA